MIIALALGILVPTTYLFFNYSSESSAKTADSQLIKAGRDIISTAESVYFSGEGSRLIMEISMPDGVDEAYILANRELVFNTTSRTGENEAVFFSSVNITVSGCTGNKCILAWMSGAGLKKVHVESVSSGNQVLISSG